MIDKFHRGETTASPSLAWFFNLETGLQEELVARLISDMREHLVPAKLSLPALATDLLIHRGAYWPSNSDWRRTSNSYAPVEANPFVDTLSYEALDHVRRDIASVSRLSQRIDYAKVHLCAALSTSDWRFDCDVFPRAAARRATRRTHTWVITFAEQTFSHYADLKRILLLDWTPSIEAEPLAREAFRCLSDLTPAHSQLVELYHHDRPRAFDKLAQLLDGYVDQLRETTALAEELAAHQAGEAHEHDEARREALQADLLARAGQTLSVRDAAKRLGMTRQNLHKRIKTGSALGVMVGKEILVPTFQFVDNEGDPAIMEHLRDILLPFAESGAGTWSALQFLIEADPNLERAPIEALRVGEHAVVRTAALAYLGLDDA